MLFLKILFIIILSPVICSAKCDIYNSNNTKAENLHDGVFYVLSTSEKCPKDVYEWNILLKKNGLKHSPSMVANRGRNNPNLGSFSFFESVTGTIKDKNITLNQGDFFYGHFTDKHNNQIILDQSFSTGKLLIELIAWDYNKQLFNFYELKAESSQSSKWFYRGNSLDALNDNTFLYRENKDQPKFGNRMRCSACHTSGGPIMKELTAPHNDWWTIKRPLSFGGLDINSSVKQYIESVSPAENFASNIKIGIQKLERSITYQKAKSNQTLQEQLRPLFCEQEINIESDNLTNEENNSVINIPSAFFINPLLASKRMIIDRYQYESLIKKYKLFFPETTYRDSDHAWLIPVKGYSDLIAIQSLIKKKVISDQFAKKILSIDSQNVLFSKSRCELLKLVPNTISSNWESDFLNHLDIQNETTDNFDLLKIENHFLRMIELRNSVYNSEISQNPLGQILEPGFRIVFPEIK